MEKMIETSPETSSPSQGNHETPIQNQSKDLNSPTSANEIRKTSTPDRLKVPKPFKYPERYTSPTDQMMSPVSKGLLTRNRKSIPLLPPTINQHKTEDSKFQDLGLFADLKC